MRACDNLVMNEISFDLFSKEHEASQKFDYFICSIAGALFAYIGQAYTPHIFDSWYYFLMPLALISLTISFMSGLWLIKVSKDITKLNQEQVSLIEENQHIQAKLSEREGGKLLEQFWNELGQLASRQDLMAMMQRNGVKIAEKGKQAATKMKFANKLEKTRNISLGVGFILILASKFSQPYFATK